MTAIRGRAGMALGVLVVVVLLAACGSDDNPKVSDSAAFISTCEKQAQKQDSSNPQLAAFLKTHAPALCRCIQQKFVAAGLSDKSYKDSALRNRPETTACGRQVLVRGG